MKNNLLIALLSMSLFSACSQGNQQNQIIQPAFSIEM